MEIIRNGLVTDEQIKEAISEKYDVSLDNIKVTYNVYHQSANYSFVKNEGGKFSTMSNNKLDDDELFGIIKSILHEEKISFHSIKPRYVINSKSDETRYVGFSFTYI